MTTSACDFFCSSPPGNLLWNLNLKFAVILRFAPRAISSFPAGPPISIDWVRHYLPGSPTQTSRCASSGKRIYSHLLAHRAGPVLTTSKCSPTRCPDRAWSCTHHDQLRRDADCAGVARSRVRTDEDRAGAGRQGVGQPYDHLSQIRIHNRADVLCRYLEDLIGARSEPNDHGR